MMSVTDSAIRQQAIREVMQKQSGR